MVRGSIARRTSNGVDASAAYELIAPVLVGTGVRLLELLVTLAAATASTYGLGRPAAKGTTPTTPVALLSEEGALHQMKTATALAWAVGPTVPAQFFRRVSFPATISSSILWTFPKGIVLLPGETIVLWNLATNGVVDVTAVVEEVQP